MYIFTAAIALITLQRLIELRISKRNTAALLKKGGVEFGRGHYWVLVALHSLFLSSLIIEGLFRGIRFTALTPVFLAVFIICQAARVWIIRSLQGRWTTRIIVLPGIGPIQEGPYLILPHPNYLIVAFELAALPLLFGLYWTAWIFTVLNAGILLLIRIPEENRGLKWASSNGATLDREQQAN